MDLWHQRLAVGKTPSVGAFVKVCIKLIQFSILSICVQVSTVAADQTAEELPALFAQLLNETDSESSTALEGQIWQHWLSAPDKNSANLLSQISNAMGVRRFEIALRLSNQLVDSYPDFAEAWNKRATIHYLMRNYAMSVADIRETVRLEPRHFGAISGLGMIFLQENNIPAALQAFEQVLKISPASSNAKRSVERVRREIGREI
ncbi:MAG: tetratricopeptide (TPR) repeat protein [Granulosicoccus sp.]|jgi:tetratricopeptide (TPR) repeat protein